MNKELSHRYTVYSNTLYILESLINEHKTGKWLYEDLVSITYDNEIFKIRYVPIENRNQFEIELNLIKKEIKENLRLPIIHLEAHGDKNGFEIAQTKEFINWRELNQELAEINFLCHNNLILSLGICYGHYINLDLVTRFSETKRCPFLVNISPDKEISPSEIKYGFSNFYKALFRDKEFYSAMTEMKEISKLNFLTTADTIAKKITKDLKSIAYSRDMGIKTASQLQEFINQGKNYFPARNFNRQLRAFKKYKRDYKKEDLKKKWIHFLMIDVYDDDKSRFEPFEEIWK